MATDPNRKGGMGADVGAWPGGVRRDIRIQVHGGDGLAERRDQALRAGLTRLAKGAEYAGGVMDERGRRLQQRGGMASRAGQALHATGNRLEEGAEYLRTHELGTIKVDLTQKIRRHPYASIGTALAAGFALGRLLGGLPGRGRRRRQKRMADREAQSRQAVRDGSPEGGGTGRIRRWGGAAAGAGASLLKGAKNRVAG